MKTRGLLRGVSMTLVLLLHLGFLWVLQGLQLSTPKPPAPSPRLAPTVLVLLAPSQTQSKSPPLPEKKLLLQPTRAGNVVSPVSV